MTVLEKSQDAMVAPPSPGAVLEIVETLARELQPQRTSWRALTLDASLERDLGLDSLGRVELLARLERAFTVRLPEDVLGAAESPRDLLTALLTAHPATEPGAQLEIVHPLAAAEAAPDRTRTLVEVLEWHAQRHGERRHVLYLPGDGEPEELSYGELAARARAVAAGLSRLGVGRGQAVGIMLPTGLEYFAAFLGAQLAGGIPVPLYPPARRSQIEDHLRRQAGILRPPGPRFSSRSPRFSPWPGSWAPSSLACAGWSRWRSSPPCPAWLRPPACARTTSPSSSSPPAAPATPRAWCSPMPTCWPISGPSPRAPSSGPATSW